MDPGLCGGCAWRRELRTKGGQTLTRCGLSDSDARFARFPRLPALSCSGYRPPA